MFFMNLVEILFFIYLWNEYVQCDSSKQHCLGEESDKRILDWMEEPERETLKNMLVWCGGGQSETAELEGSEWWIIQELARLLSLRRQQQAQTLNDHAPKIEELLQILLIDTILCPIIIIWFGVKIVYTIWCSVYFLMVLEVVIVTVMRHVRLISYKTF